MANVGNFDYGLIAKKFEMTETPFNDMNTIDDFNRNILKDTGSDPTILASDIKRKDNYSKTQIQLREQGTRWVNEPIHNDMYLYDPTPDARGNTDQPDLRKLTDYNWKKKDDWKNSLGITVNNSVPSQGISESAMVYNKNEMNKRLMKMQYYKDFGTSKDGWGIPYNTLQSKHSKAGMIEQTNQLMDLNDEYGMEKRRDITTILSNILPIGYWTTPSNEFNVADYGILYGKQKIDTNDYIKNSYKSKKSGTEPGEAKENQLAKQLNIFLSDIKNNKEKLMNKDQEIKYGNSNDTTNKDISNNKESYSNRDLRKGEESQQLKQLVAQIVYNYKKQVDRYRKNNDFNQTDMSLPESVNEGNDILSQVKSLASQQTDLKSAMNSIIETHNKNKMDICNNNDSVLYKVNHNLFNNNRLNEDTIIDFNNDSINTSTYKRNNNNNTQDKYNEMKFDFDFDPLNQNNTDINSKHYATNQFQADISNINDFETNNEFGENKYLNRNIGSIGTKYQFNDYNTDQISNDMNDTSNSRTKRYNGISNNKPYIQSITLERGIIN